MVCWAWGWVVLLVMSITGAPRLKVSRKQPVMALKTEACAGKNEKQEVDLSHPCLKYGDKASGAVAADHC